MKSASDDSRTNKYINCAFDALLEQRSATAPFSWYVVAASLILVVLTGAFCYWPTWRAMFPIEIDINEAWNSFHADRVLAGLPLYPATDSLVTNNYPPLSFVVVGAISSLGIDAVYVGRALSLIAILAIAWGIAALVMSLVADRFAACIAAVWFVATLARFYTAYFSMNDPSLPALAVMVWALVWCLRDIAAGRPSDGAIVLMVIAGFYKHSLIAIPLTTLIWIAIVQRRYLLRAVLIASIALTIGFSVCGIIWGQAFFQQLLSPRKYDLVSLGNVTRLQWIAPALLCFAVFARHDFRERATLFVALLAIVGFFSQLFQKLGEGVADNAHFELVIAAALGIGIVIARADRWPIAGGPNSNRVIVVVLATLIIRLLASGNNHPYYALASPDFRAEVRQHASIATAESERVRTMQGPVACSIALVCRFAGKSYAIDRFNTEQKIRTGRLSLEQVNAMIVDAGIRSEQIDPRASANFD